MTKESNIFEIGQQINYTNLDYGFYVIHDFTLFECINTEILYPGIKLQSNDKSLIVIESLDSKYIKFQIVEDFKSVKLFYLGRNREKALSLLNKLYSQYYSKN